MATLCYNNSATRLLNSICMLRVTSGRSGSVNLNGKPSASFKFPFVPRHPMNKNDLIESMSAEFELTRSYARDLVDRVFETMTQAAHEGEEVAIHGFGKFKVVERGARKGRNPQTGETVKIAARKVLKFEAAKAMKEGLNTKRRARRKA